MVLTLTTLDSDVLQAIIRSICDHSGYPTSFERNNTWRQLLPLSLVSKRLRSECIPHVFREWSHSIVKPGNLIPESLWDHIRVLRLLHPGVPVEDMYEQEFAAEEIFDAFPLMKNVSKCIYTRIPGPLPSFTAALASLPSLSEFELIDSTFQTPFNPQFELISGLSRFVFRMSDYWRRQYPTYAFSAVETHYLMILISGSVQTLEYLEMPGSSVRLEEMAQWSWPNLRHLVLHDDALQSDGLIALLRKTPRLRALDVQFPRGSGQPPFIIYPNGPDPHAPCGDDIPQLRSLTLTNPSPDDGIFFYLADVLHLSLSVLPAAYSYVEGVSLLRAPIWEANRAAEVLLCSKMPNLVRLRISVQGQGFTELVKCISQAFPLLEYLELHHYPVQPPRSVEIFDLPLPPLASLVHLKELRLDLNILNNEEDEQTRGPSKALLSRENERSMIIAEAIPQLDAIGFLFRRPDESAYWTIRHISRDGAVRVDLEAQYWKKYPYEELYFPDLG